MKSIPQIILFTLTVGGIISCQSQSNVKYANSLENCLGPSEISLLNSLCQKFETHITSTYELGITDSYKQYLMNVVNGDFPQGFFNYNSFNDDINEFHSSEFYQNSWVKTSNLYEGSIIEVPPTIVNGKIQTQEAPEDPLVLDPKGKYVQCLLSMNKVKAMNDYLEIVKAGIDVSPGLVASALKDNLSEEDLNNDFTRLIIAINFHYQIGLYVAGK